MSVSARDHLRSGVAIPAHPLALTIERELDERRQKALTRYYLDAGAGGLAVGVHTTQFPIRDVGLYRPVLALAAEVVYTTLAARPRPFVMVAGLAGNTEQALREAETAVTLGYDAGLLSLGALRDASDENLIFHCRAVSEVIPLFGFYLQPAVGGRVLGHSFWRAFAEIERLWAIKIAPFDRYRTLDVIRGVCEAGRDDVALYTGNDDNILGDLLTAFPFTMHGDRRVRWMDGGLLGQWAVWTKRAVELLTMAKRVRESGKIDLDLLRVGAALTDANGAIFDAAHNFAGCIPGIHEILRRQGLLENLTTLDAEEKLSPGQAAEIDRVIRAYPFLTDDDFVSSRREDWLRAS